MAATKNINGKSKVVNIKVPLQVKMSAERADVGKTGLLQPGISQASLELGNTYIISAHDALDQN